MKDGPEIKMCLTRGLCASVANLGEAGNDEVEKN